MATRSDCVLREAAVSRAADQYKDAYANLLVEMEEQIAAIAEKGEKEE